MQQITLLKVVAVPAGCMLHISFLFGGFVVVLFSSLHYSMYYTLLCLTQFRSIAEETTNKAECYEIRNQTLSYLERS